MTILFTVLLTVLYLMTVVVTRYVYRSFMLSWKVTPELKDTANLYAFVPVVNIVVAFCGIIGEMNDK